MDVLARLDQPRGAPDNLPVAPQHATWFDPFQRDFVADRYGGSDGDLSPVDSNRLARSQRYAGDSHVIRRVQMNSGVLGGGGLGYVDQHTEDSLLGAAIHRLAAVGPAWAVLCARVTWSNSSTHAHIPDMPENRRSSSTMGGAA